MKDVLGLAFLLLCAVHIHGLSILTGNSGPNITQLDTNDLDSKNVDVFRQLLNQETIIRIGLVKNVHALMKDMIMMKQSLETLESASQKTNLEMTDLRREVDKLKHENQRLELANREYDEIFNNVRGNFTQINEYFQDLEEKRQGFEANMSTILGDLKVEVRYLSITLLDLNKHTLEIDKDIPKVIGDKYDQLSTRLSNFMETVNGSQNTIITSLFDEVNKTIVDLKAEVKESQFDQMKLSSTVSALEVFRMNMSMNQCGITRKVAFTVGVSSTDSSWNSGTLVFPRVVYNIGGGYDPNTGVFTAPVDGHFVFFVNVQSYSSQHIYTYLVLNGTPKVTTTAYSPSYSSGPNMAVLSLQKGDRVWVKRYAGKGYYTESDAPITTFSGFLI
ncbi:uncharacterized protein LOC125657463 [Ostrea edulis]|uniref:uncharacterized protein LOC125657463 n=1 Tax=Ostrea edulis TaxID=37623 RepID=UPI0024AEE773|nr:uncharacterized protein LOC125657463 [Ostrea edulis]